MKIRFFHVAAVLTVAAPSLAADIPGGKDHPLVGRYEGSTMTFFETQAFDEQRLIDKAIASPTSTAADDSDSMRVEGAVTRIRYDAPDGRSGLEIVRNFGSSMKARGFVQVFSCDNQNCLSGDTAYFRFGAAADDMSQNFRYQDDVHYILEKLARPEGDVYAAVVVGGKTPPVVRVTVVETKAMESGKIAFVDASQMAKAIAANGKVALYGIYFDTDKADVKPESKPTLDEIAKFLKANPTINVVVAGHTDSQGGYDYNIDLSKRRAQAVTVALASYGIPASRLTPFGVGMAAPIAVNDDDAGRAKNRRVELVKR